MRLIGERNGVDAVYSPLESLQASLCVYSHSNGCNITLAMWIAVHIMRRFSSTMISRLKRFFNSA